MRFGILGPLEAIDDDGRRLMLGGPKQRAVLAILLLRANEVVSSERLIEELWSGEPPASAAKSLQVHVSRLRSALTNGGPARDERIVTANGGYELRVAPGELDRDRFDRLVAEGAAAIEAGAWELASERFREALGSWRGRALSDFEYDTFAQAEIRRLDELRLSAVERRVDADLQLGRHAQLIGELEALVDEHPTREHIAAQLMLALYRSGRQADALDVYQRTRARLADQLGLEPGHALKTLQTSVLQQAPALLVQPDWIDRAKVAAPADLGSRPADMGPPAGRGLPVPPTPTVGRRQEIEEVSRLLQSNEARVVTLVGPGGVGKTHLALTAARTAESSFRDGAYWVELAGVGRPQDVGATIARALALTPLPGESADQALTRYLSHKRLLLVIDNFEHVLDAAGLVAQMHDACPQLTILTTSREPLNLAAECRFSVTPLTLPTVTDTVTVAEVESTDATALFLAAARRHDSRLAITPDTAPVIARVCARLDGLPLALELAAARLGLLSVHELSGRLDLALGDLGTGPRDAPARHRTLQATIDWSYHLLDPAQRDVFVRFAVFAGGATIEAAQAVTAARLSTLQALVDKSLIGRYCQPDGSTRLVMLETVRHHALQRLTDHPERDAVHQHHLDHYLQLAGRTAPRLSTHDEPHALLVLDSEIDNLTSALQWAIGPAPNLALRLSGLLGDYWRIRHDLDGLAWLEAALQAAGADAPARDCAHARLGRATQLSFRHRGPEAIEELERALALYRHANDHAGISRTLCSLAPLLGAAGDIDQERRCAEGACRHARLAGDDALLGSALARLAPRLPAAERGAVLEQAAELLARVGDYRALATAYSDAAYVALTSDRVREATRMLEHAFRAAGTGNSPLPNEYHGNVGLAKLFSGDLHGARKAFECQLELCARHAFSHEGGDGLAGLAAVAAAARRHEIAARLRGAARSSGYPPTAMDKLIEDRLERDYFGPARARDGRAAWARAEEEGATLSVQEATAYALGEARLILMEADTKNNAPLSTADDSKRPGSHSRS